MMEGVDPQFRRVINEVYLQNINSERHKTLDTRSDHEPSTDVTVLNVENPSKLKFFKKQNRLLNLEVKRLKRELLSKSNLLKISRRT